MTGARRDPSRAALRNIAVLLIALGCLRLLSLCAGGATRMRLALGLGSIGVGWLCLELRRPQRLPRAVLRARKGTTSSETSSP